MIEVWERPYTSEKPTEPGLYMHKGEPWGDECSVIVAPWMDKLVVSRDKTDWLLLSECDGLWHGPIEPKVTRKKREPGTRKFLKIKDYPDAKRSLVWLMEKQGAVNAFYMAAELPTWKANDLSEWFASMGVKTVREESKLEHPNNPLVVEDEDGQDEEAKAEDQGAEEAPEDAAKT